MFCHLGNMKQTFFSRQDLDKCPKVHDTSYLAFVDLARFRFFGQQLDLSYASLCALHIRRCDINQTSIVDIDLDTGFCDDAIDSLASRSDDSTDVIRIDMHGDDPRCIW